MIDGTARPRRRGSPRPPSAAAGTRSRGFAPIMPYAASAPARRGARPRPWPPSAEDLAVVVGTSGSTGTPKRALLTAARAAGERRGHPRPDRRPRSVAARPARPAHRRAPGPPALPPRRHDARRPRPCRRLRRPDLLGGGPRRMDPGEPGATCASCPPSSSGSATTRGAPRPCATSTPSSSVAPPCRPLLRRHAEDCGVPVVPTYGMSETGGRLRLRRAPARRVPRRRRRRRPGPPRRRHPRPTGYLGRPDLTAAAFHDGWFRTDDVGHLGADGRLHVDGRVDDVINTGGIKVAPRLVEDAIAEHVPGVREVVVVGVPDPAWGEAVERVPRPRPAAGREPTVRRPARRAARHPPRPRPAPPGPHRGGGPDPGPGQARPCGDRRDVRPTGRAGGRMRRVIRTLPLPPRAGARRSTRSSTASRPTRARVRGLPKVVWVFVILLFPFVGPLGWLLAGRPRAADGPGASPWGPRQQSERRDRRPMGPDDDPDFLKGL